MLNMQVPGKRRRGRPTNRWLGNIRDDMKEYKMTKDMAQNPSVWHMKTKVGPLLHGGGLRMGEEKLRSTNRDYNDAWGMQYLN